MRNVGRAVAALALAALVAGCSNPFFRGDDGDAGGQPTGTIEIRLSESITGQTIQPDTDMVIAQYQITVDGPGDTVSKTVPGDSTAPVVIDELVPGEWTVTVNAKNDEGVIIATDETQVTVVANETATANLTVVPVDGEGTLNLTVTWPAGAIDDPIVHATLAPIGRRAQNISDKFGIDTSGDPETASYSQSWESGYYQLLLSLQDGYRTVWGPRTAAVRIVGGAISSALYELAEGDLNLQETGSLEINIGADLQNPFVVTLSGVEDIREDEVLNVTAAIDGDGTADSFAWYVDGELLDGATDSSVTIDPAALGLAVGDVHWVDVIVVRGETLSSAGASFRVEPQGLTMQLLHFADIDGDEEAALDSVDEFSALVEGFKADPTYGANTVVVSSGDNIIPGPRYFAAENSSVRALTGSNEPGHADHFFLKRFGVVASAVGNHELDQGPGEFGDAFFGDGLAPGFPYLAANLDFSAEDVFTIGADGQDYTAVAGQIARSATVTVGGERIGLVGASTPDLDTITSTGGINVLPPGNWTPADLAAEIQPVVDALVADGVNKIVLLAHMQQLAIEEALAELLTGVDVIVGGGSNTLLADSDDVLRPGDVAAGSYPKVFDSASDEPVLLVNVDGDYQYLGRLVVTFDAGGVIDLDSLDEALNGSWASTPAIAAAVGGTPDADLVAVRDALQAVIAAQFGNVVGNTNVFLEGRRERVRTEETNLGNLTADANLWYANLFSADHVAVSIKNGGGIRTEIGEVVVPPGSDDPADIQLLPPQASAELGTSDGDISQGNLAATLRFDNGLVLLDATAAELKDLLEHAVEGTAPGATPGQFPQVGGIWFSFDPSGTPRTTAGTGTRIQDLVVLDSDGAGTPDTVVSGGAIVGDPSRVFRIVTLNFLANGGDDYPFPALSAANRSQLYSSVGFGDPDTAPAGVPDFPIEPNGDPGNQSTFSYTGGEQDALAEYLLAAPDANFVMGSYDRADTAPADDRRVQNLDATGVFTAP